MPMGVDIFKCMVEERSTCEIWFSRTHFETIYTTGNVFRHDEIDHMAMYTHRLTGVVILARCFMLK